MSDSLSKTSLRTAFFCFALLFVTTYVAVAFMAYTPYWYSINCNWHPRCEILGIDIAQDHIVELAGYLRHQNELTSTMWSEKERKHLIEVRAIYSQILAAFLITLAVFIYLLRDRAWTQLKWAAKINLAFLALCLCAMPWFKEFWHDVFHPIFFSNMDWFNTPKELSYWITPQVFFKYSAITIVVFLVLVHTGVLYALRSRPSITTND
jgi:hypothetical protein